MTIIPATQLKVSETKILEFRWLTYRLLASLFLYPDKERLAGLQIAAKVLMEDSIWDGFLSQETLEDLLNQLIDTDLKNGRPIINEYNRLFLIRPKAQPHETVYTDPEGQMRGMLTAQLEERYLEAGLVISPELNELPDHISVELEFMAFLCMKEVDARLANEDKVAIHFRALQESFMRQHLVRWFPKFAQRIKESEPGSIYHFLLPAVYNYLRHELGVLGLGN